MGFGIKTIVPENLFLLSYLLKYAFSLLLAFFLLSKPNEQLTLQQPINIKNVLKSIVITLGLIIVTMTMNRLLPYQSVSNTSFKPNVEKFILMVILAPVLEELLYRKWYLGSFLKEYKTVPYYYFVLFSALLFGFTHYRLGINNVVYNTIMGVGYGLIFVKYRNIKLCICTHFFNNFLAFLVNFIR